jgi:hypothetical protein
VRSGLSNYKTYRCRTCADKPCGRVITRDCHLINNHHAACSTSRFPPTTTTTTTTTTPSTPATTTPMPQHHAARAATTTTPHRPRSHALPKAGNTHQSQQTRRNAAQTTGGRPGGEGEATKGRRLMSLRPLVFFFSSHFIIFLTDRHFLGTNYYCWQ